MVVSTTRAENIAALLRNGLCRGDYLCGERLVELTLSQTFGVSQNTIRDALHILEQEGWVVKQARRGVYVRAFSVDEAQEIYTLWATLEGLALRWGLPKLTRSHRKSLQQLLDRTRQQVELRDWSEALALIFQFHALITAIGQRPQTAAFLERLYNQARLLEITRERCTPRGLYGWLELLENYQALLTAIDARDLPQALAHLNQLLESNSQQVVACL